MKKYGIKYKIIFFITLMITSQVPSKSFNSKAYHQLISKLQIQNESVKNLEAFTNVLLPIKRTERKDICLKVLKTYENINPKVAYTAANCLIYNGYGELAIPLFSRYLYNGHNEKYFNKRIGYGWLHAGNWYKVDSKILTNMLEGLDFYTWVTTKIENEILMHPKLYGQKTLSHTLKQKMKKILMQKPLTLDENKLFRSCSNIFIHVDTYTCSFKKEDKKLEECQKTLTSFPSLLECRD